jgi:ABC-2 type transport system ATP-binding protein
MSVSTEAAAVAAPVAELRGASMRFGAAHALCEVDLAIERARVTVLLGPNGAGKTTAIRLLLGLLAPSSGGAALFGADPRSRVARERVGAMMQVAKVPEMLRVCEHIDTFRSYYPRPLRRTELIEMAGLHGLERRLYGTLSGGEKQRVMLALALAGNPELLFLDEPSVGMDVETRRALWSRIRSLRDEGRAVLLTTHYLDEADALADRVVVLKHGRIAADAPPHEIRQRIVQRRVRCATALDVERVRALPGVVSAEREGGAVIIHATRAEQVVHALLTLDPRLSGLEVGGAALEDAFLDIVEAA